MVRGMTMKVKKLVDGLKDIDQAHAGEWYDLRCAEDITMEAGESRLIPLGVAIDLPEGYEALMVPRSSTFKKWGILQTNGIGVIDNKYCGDGDQWYFPALAMRKTRIHKNDRICQFRLMYQTPKCDMKYVDTLWNDNRGGLGSTGKD